MEAIIQDSNIWNNVLGLVEKRLNRQIFDSWFLPIRFEGCDEKSNTLSLRAGRVTKDWVCSYYSDLIELCMRDLNMSNYRLDWHIEETEQPETEFPDDDNEIFSRPVPILQPPLRREPRKRRRGRSAKSVDPFCRYRTDREFA